MRFESSNSWHQEIAKYKITNIWKVSIKTLCRKWVENVKYKLFPNASSFLNNLKNEKQMLSWQSSFNKSFQTYLLSHPNFPYFSTKKESENEGMKLLREK